MNTLIKHVGYATTMLNVIALTACIMALTACADDDQAYDKDADSISIIALVSHQPTGTVNHSGNGNDTRATVATRTGDGNTTPYTPAGGKLYLCYQSLDNATPDEKAVYTCSDGTWSTAAPIYWNNLTPETGANGGTLFRFFAAAPQIPVPTTTEPTGTPAASTPCYSVNANQSALADYTASDQLIAYTTATERRSKLTLTFHHVLSQLTVELGNETGDLSIADATLSVKGPKTDYTLSYDGATPDVPATATVPDGAIATTGATPYITGTSSVNATTTRTFALILPPQTLETGALTLTFTIGGRSYTWIKTDPWILSAGTNHSVTLNVSKSAISLAEDGIRVKPWEDVTGISGILKIDISGTAGTATGDAAAFTTMQLWKNRDNQTAAVKYDKTGNAWAAATGAMPFYLDDLDLAGTDLFYATATNVYSTTGVTPPAGKNAGDAITDATTGLTDLLSAGPTAAAGGRIALTFGHLTAQFAVSLKLDDAMPAATSLEGATVSMPEMKKEFTYIYKVEDNTYRIAAKEAGATATYANLATTKTTAGNGATAGNEAYSTATLMVVPQTIPQTGKFTVTLSNGKTYTATPSAPITLEAGKTNTLTLTLKPTAMTLGDIVLTPWTTDTSTGSATADGLTPGSSTLTAFTEAGTFYLATNTGGTGSSTGGSTGTILTGIYPISYSNSAATLAAGASPIYWEQLPHYSTGTNLAEYTYSALYVPTACRNGATGTSSPATAGDDNHEKDYLTATSAATPWGTPPAFGTGTSTGTNADATKLKHATAQLTVKLTSTGGTFTTANLDAAAITTPSTMKMQVNTADATLTTAALTAEADGATQRTVKLKTDSKSAPATPATGNAASHGFTALLAPQTLKQLVIVLDRKTYTLDSTKLTGAGTLTAGHNRILTIDVAKTSIGFDVQLTDWQDDPIGTIDITIDPQ